MSYPMPSKTSNMRGGMSSYAYDRSNYDIVSMTSNGSNQGSVCVSDSNDFSQAGWRELWNPRASMSFNSAKGLLNPVGENNCFLNSAVQVLWHLDVFRRNFRLLTGHACMQKSCIFCALKLLFTNYQFSDRQALPSDVLRRALANTFANQQKFQMGNMDDASECFENILQRLHQHVAVGHSEDFCRAPHCITHQKFAMSVVEQVFCGCGAICDPLNFMQTVYYVSTTALMNQVLSTRSQRLAGVVYNFGQFLSIAKNAGEMRKCPSNCGRPVETHRKLTNTPDVISVGLSWDSERPSMDHIAGVVNSIDAELWPKDLFNSVSNQQWLQSTRFQLVGVVCYYAKHYSTFFFHSKMKTWILFDDACVKDMGPDWRSVVHQCCRGRYQPLLLLYANSNTSPLDVSTAPTNTFKMPEPTPVERKSTQTCNYQKEVYQKRRPSYPPTEYPIHRHSSSMSTDEYQGPARQNEIPVYDKVDGFIDRQPSYLCAVTSRCVDDSYVDLRQKSTQLYQKNPRLDMGDLSASRSNVKNKTVRFNNKVDGVTPSGQSETYFMCDSLDRNHPGSVRPAMNQLGGSMRRARSVEGNIASEINFQQQSIPSSGVRGSRISAPDNGAYKDRRTSNPVAGINDWLRNDWREEEDNTVYIDPKTVQNVLKSQGVKSKLSSRTRNSAGTQNCGNSNVQKLSVVPVGFNARLLGSGVYIQDSDLLGSSRDHGYQSGDGSSSLLDSPSLDSNDFADHRLKSSTERNLGVCYEADYQLSSSSDSFDSSLSSQSFNISVRTPQPSERLRTICEHDISEGTDGSRTITSNESINVLTDNVQKLRLDKRSSRTHPAIGSDSRNRTDRCTTNAEFPSSDVERLNKDDLYDKIVERFSKTGDNKNTRNPPKISARTINGNRSHYQTK